MKAAPKPRAYQQVARAQAQERTREALVDAAEAVFFEGRWGQTSLDALATSAGVTKQTLLRHFGSKEALLEQALLRSRERVHDQRWAAPADDIAGAVENLLDHYAEWGERLLRLLAADRLGTELPWLALIAQEGRKLHCDWVEHAFGRWLQDLSPPVRVRRRATLIALCDPYAWWLLSHRLDLPRRQVQAALTETIQRLLEDRG
jgi:AcrR family transcriptional regulator